jgi:cytochrome c-type biogenesis protein CcmH
VILWILIGALTLATIAAIVRPLVRPRGVAAPRAAFDRAIYRDQLAELERDQERGVLDAEQAAAARLEIERRLLATEPSSPRKATEAAPAPVDGITAASLAAAVSAGAIAVYLAIGSPGVGDAPFAARPATPVAASAAATPADLAASIAALEARLKDRPDDAAGWLLLARSEAAQEHWQQSAEAYRHAMALTPTNADVAAGYGEMLVMAAGGIVTPAAHDAFVAAAERDPANPPARFYLALGDAQAGKPAAALEQWAALIAQSPPDAPWLAMVRQSMAATARDAGLPMPSVPESREAPDVAASGSPGPSAAAIAAARQMTPEERQQMIRGMVEKLAARLENDPADAAGWARLANAYRVLGEDAKAAEAEKRAAAVPQVGTPSSSGTDVPALLGRARAMLKDGGADRDVRVPIPATAVDLLREIEKRDPDQPDALWYLGLAAAQRHDIDGAAARWQRLLGLLDPNGDQYKTVQAALGALQQAK